MKWGTCTFEELYAEPSKNGLNRPKRVRGKGYKMVNMGELFLYDRIQNQPMELVPMNENEILSYKLQKGDLLFARQSLVLEGTGKCSIISDVQEVTSFESHIIRVRLNQKIVNPFFYYYYFCSPMGKSNIQSIVMQVAASGIRGSELAKLKVPVPPIGIQNKISLILSAFDDLIENNTRRIQILEEMAQTIYREWFVNFRFPGHENVRFVETEMGKTPLGWEFGKLNDVLAELESGSRPKGGIDPNESEIPSIGAENILGLGKYDFSKEKFVTRKFFENMTRGHVKNNDVLLYKDGASLGRKSLFRNGFPHNECCVNEHVFILRTNDRCTQSYLYLFLDQPDMTQNIRNLNSNAAQPGINQVGVKGLPILIPEKVILQEFENMIDPIFTLLFTLAKKNLILQKTRDLLIPKLISGQINLNYPNES